MENRILKKLDLIDGRLDGIDRRLSGIDGRLDGIDTKFDDLSFELNEFQITTKREFGRVHEKLDKTDNNSILNGDRLAKLDKKLNLELLATRSRFERIESHCGI